MVFTSKLFVVLACLSVLRLVVSDNVKVVRIYFALIYNLLSNFECQHVVSNQDDKGGNCITANFLFVCSDKMKTYYTNVNILSLSEDDSDSAITYGIGFSNSCFDRWTMVSQLKITWSKITSEPDVYFRDDQCFWSTEGGHGKSHPLIVPRP